MIIHNPILTGSFSVNGADLSTITGSVSTSASFNARTTYLESTSSILTAASASQSVTSGSLVAASASLSATSGSLSAASGSFNTRVSALEATGSALSSSLLTVSGSGYATSASLSAASGSFNSRVATIESKYATTGSNTFIGTQVVSGSILQSGSFTSTGTLTAQTLVIQTITSSVVYSSGSNVFGNSLGNSQVFTGSVLITGSLGIGVPSTNGIIEVNGRIVASNGGGANRVALNIESNTIATAYSAINSYNYSSSAARPLVINESGGRVIVGSNTDDGSTIFQVNGTGKFTSDLYLTATDAKIWGGTSAGRLILANSTSTTYGIFYGATNATPNVTTFVNNAALTLTLNANNTATFSGALSGTSATFSSSVTSSGTITAKDATNDASVLMTGLDGAYGLIQANNAAGSLTKNLVLQKYGGNVGIGTGSPLTNFSVAGANGITDSFGQSFIYTTDTQAADYGGQITMGGLFSTSRTAFGYIAARKTNSSSGDSQGYLSLGSNSGSALTERMRITSGGMFGIGTTSPTNTLQVNGNIKFGVYGLVRNTQVTLTGNSTSGDIFRLLDSNGNLLGAGTISGTLYIVAFDTTTGGNQTQYQYTWLSGGNGTGNASFTQTASLTRGTNPLPSITMVNDGAGGGTKITGTSAASGVSGAYVWVTFIGIVQ